MWTDQVYLGPAPAAEGSAQVGRADYERRAHAECSAYIEAIRKCVGREPDGARLRVDRQDREFGPFLEVVCEYDGNNPEAARYAARCEEDAPTTWATAGMTAPARPAPSPQSGKRYVGTRTPDACAVTVVAADGTEAPLHLRFDLRNHSPDGNGEFAVIFTRRRFPGYPVKFSAVVPA